MPKIIKDVDNIIKNCAMELFMKYGYIKVDMRMISVQSKIAVGTIYHYYKNKQELYLKVLNESWEVTLIKLDESILINCTSEEKIYRLITTLYNDIKNRNGLGKVLFDNSVEELKSNNFFTQIKENLLVKVNDIISCIYIEKDEFKSTSRLTETLLVSIVVMIELHPNDEAENIEFLKQLVQ